MSDTQQRTLSGAAIGSAVGVGIGALTGGGLLWGAVGGAAVGGASGYVYDLYDKDQNKNKKPPQKTKPASSSN
ncbi:hypothetical protein G6688_04935 [Polynucleobacter paneuropaeus]|nr:hypothetical protein G6689_05085 [Polynucleobacter paneuropaeus]QWD23295.1 hypothetical protein G6688_04935 [Polynucleobacter paneuropaeus]